MAYRRSISSIRSMFLARRLNPSFTYISHDRDRTNQQELLPLGSKIGMHSSQIRSLGSYVHNPSWQFTHTFRRTGCQSLGSRLHLNRYLSTSTGEIVTKVTDAPIAVEAVGEVFSSCTGDLNRAAILIQNISDAIHSSTGLNWWASIAIIFFVLRVGLTPLHILLLKMKDPAKFEREAILPPQYLLDLLVMQMLVPAMVDLADHMPLLKSPESFTAEGFIYSILCGIASSFWLFSRSTKSKFFYIHQSVSINFVSSVSFYLGNPKALFILGVLPIELVYLCLGLALKNGRFRKALGISKRSAAQYRSGALYQKSCVLNLVREIQRYRKGDFAREIQRFRKWEDDDSM